MKRLQSSVNFHTPLQCLRERLKPHSFPRLSVSTSFYCFLLRFFVSVTFYFYFLLLSTLYFYILFLLLSAFYFYFLLLLLSTYYFYFLLCIFYFYFLILLLSTFTFYFYLLFLLSAFYFYFRFLLYFLLHSKLQKLRSLAPRAVRSLCMVFGVQNT